jgi:RNA polymerase sigma factor (sigma-70 family)
MKDDSELLREFVETGSEPAFAEIVLRQKSLVYWCALRQTGNAAMAEEIVQAVFIVLSRKARTLKPNTILSGWLFRATRFAVADALKRQHRRERREQIFAMNLENPNPANSENEMTWEEIAPALDESLARLTDSDRHALLLRFFEQKKLADVGGALGLSEEGARKRVDRALDKLRVALGKRGVVLPAALLSTLLIANAAPAVPVALTVSAAAATTPLVQGTLTLMAWSKTKITVTTIVALLFINGGVLVTVFLTQKKSTPPQPEPVSAQSDAFSDQALVTTAFTESPADNEGFISLFNGRTLDGWNYNPQVWSVKDGVIVARAPLDSMTTPHYLVWAGGDVDDFELRLKVRTAENANSGVAVRARWPQQRWCPGYQAEIHGQNTGNFVIAGAGRERKLSRAGWQTIAGEADGRDTFDAVMALPDVDKIADACATVESGQWCDFVVIAQGTHFIVRLNGVTVIDTHDEHPSKFARSGVLGMEYNHRTGINDSVEFKNIRFKRLAAQAKP